MSERNNILIIRLDAIGDMIMFSAFIRELRHQEPDAEITLVISPLVKNIYINCPYVDKILYFDGRRKIKPQIITSTFRAMIWGLSDLKEKYSIAMLPRAGADAEGALMLAIMSGAKDIISFSEKQTAERSITNRGYDRFVTRKIITSTTQHEVETTLNFLRQAGYEDIKNDNIEMWFSENQREVKKVDQILEQKNIQPENILIGVGFSAAQAHRCWPIDKFKELFEIIISKDPNARFILIGGPEDKPTAEALVENSENILSFAGEVSLLETACLLKRCSLYIGNDSGPMHIAAVVKTPVIEISCFPKNGDKDHDNSPLRFGPWKTKNIILQPESTLLPCDCFCKSNTPHCINQITPNDVYKSYKEILKTQRISK